MDYWQVGTSTGKSEAISQCFWKLDLHFYITFAHLQNDSCSRLAISVKCGIAMLNIYICSIYCEGISRKNTFFSSSCFHRKTKAIMLSVAFFNCRDNETRQSEVKQSLSLDRVGVLNAVEQLFTSYYFQSVIEENKYIFQ